MSQSDDETLLHETECMIIKNDVDLSPTITVSIERIDHLCRMVRERDEKLRVAVEALKVAHIDNMTIIEWVESHYPILVRAKIAPLIAENEAWKERARINGELAWKYQAELASLRASIENAPVVYAFKGVRETVWHPHRVGGDHMQARLVDIKELKP